MQYIGVTRKQHGGFVQVGIEPKRLMEAQSRNTYDYIFSRFPTDEKEEFLSLTVKRALFWDTLTAWSRALPRNATSLTS